MSMRTILQGIDCKPLVLNSIHLLVARRKGSHHLPGNHSFERDMDFPTIVTGPTLTTR